MAQVSNLYRLNGSLAFAGMTSSSYIVRKNLTRYWHKENNSYTCSLVAAAAVGNVRNLPYSVHEYSKRPCAVEALVCFGTAGQTAYNQMIST